MNGLTLAPTKKTGKEIHVVVEEQQVEEEHIDNDLERNDDERVEEVEQEVLPADAPVGGDFGLVVEEPNDPVEKRRVEEPGDLH